MEMAKITRASNKTLPSKNYLSVSLVDHQNQWPRQWTTNQITKFTHPPIQETSEPKKKIDLLWLWLISGRQVQYLLIQLGVALLRYSDNNQSQSADDHKKPTNVNQMWSSWIAQSQRLFVFVDCHHHHGWIEWVKDKSIRYSKLREETVILIRKIPKETVFNG